MNTPANTNTPEPGELANLALAIYSTDKERFIGEPTLAIEDAWGLWQSASRRIIRHREEEAERARLEEERRAGLVPFEKIPGYVKPMPFEFAVRQALTHFNEPLPPPDVRIVVDGFAARSHVEILKRFKREMDRERQARKRKKTKLSKKKAP
jgi:hypothetical protein